MNDIMNIEEMAHFIDVFNSGNFIQFNSYNLFIEDEELKFIDALLDYGIINRLLSYNSNSNYGFRMLNFCLEYKRLLLIII